MSKQTRARSPQKKAELRQEILDAGMTLFITKGSLGFTMRTLAQEISISRPSLYTYFSNKYDLWLEIRKDCIAHFESGVKKIYEDFQPDKQKWTELFYHFVEYFFDFAEKEEMRYIMLYLSAPPQSDKSEISKSPNQNLDLTSRALVLLENAIKAKEITGKVAQNIAYFIASVMLGGSYLEILQRSLKKIPQSKSISYPQLFEMEYRDYLLQKIREELQL